MSRRDKETNAKQALYSFSDSILQSNGINILSFYVGSLFTLQAFLSLLV